MTCPPVSIPGPTVPPSIRPRSPGKQQPLPDFRCGICLDEVAGEDVYCIDSCQHRFCRPCLTSYTRGLISEHRFPLRCPQPGCSNSISTTQVSELLENQQDVDTLQRLEVESCIPDSSKFYCPNPSCSMLLIVDEPESVKQQQQQPSRCPACQETVCVACRVVWHDNLTCSEYQSLPAEMRRPEDTQTVTLQAKDAGWKACPKCRTMVELVHGCYHIVCNCGCNWCYKCGNAWSGVEAGCGCLLWDRENVALEETFRMQHYQAHGQDESHARQMAAADLVKYGLAAAAAPLLQQPQVQWSAESTAASHAQQQQQSGTASDGSADFSSIARHLFGSQLLPRNQADRFVPPLPLAALAPQAVAAALGFAHPHQQQPDAPAPPQLRSFQSPLEAGQRNETPASLLQQQQLLAHLRAMEGSQHHQSFVRPAGLKPAAPTAQLPRAQVPASATRLATAGRLPASDQHHKTDSAPTAVDNEQAAQQQRRSSSSSGRAHHRAQQLLAQQMQAAAWAAHVQAATEHMQYAMYSQQRAQVHASLHAQLQAQMDFDEQQEQDEHMQQQKLEADIKLFGQQAFPHQQHSAAPLQHAFPGDMQSTPHVVSAKGDSWQPRQSPQHSTLRHGSPHGAEESCEVSAADDTHHSVVSSPASDFGGAHASPMLLQKPGNATSAFAVSSAVKLSDVKGTATASRAAGETLENSPAAAKMESLRETLLHL